ncbi:MAG: plasma-membrane proton-efflux P-type ATPase [Spirochaetia bacterium]|jgi:H+-transporting ATPase
MKENLSAESGFGGPAAIKTTEYKMMPIEEALRELGSGLEGLSEAEVEKRLKTYGRNEMAARKKSPILEFLSRFWGPMPWLLELAIALSVFLGHDLEAVIIAILIVTNAIIGYLHSRSSQRSLELLKERLAVNAVVHREGRWATINASEIVPGDVAVVQMGDIVPADAKVLSGALSVDQSALTGESLPVETGPSDILYSSSVVKRGEAQCLVVNTGGSTFFGRTAELVQIARPKSHQEQIMLSIVRYMMYLGIAALSAVAVGALLMKIGIVTVATFAVIFLMGAVPVALPAVLTIVQAVGAMELVRKGVLVTRLDSMEDAASLDVLCLDKTGTLTLNQLSVTEVIPYAGHEVNDVLATAALTAKPESKDGIDIAVRERAQAAGITNSEYSQISVTPFEAATKRSEAVIQEGANRFRAVKGAPQVVLSLSRLTDSAIVKAAGEMVEALSRKGSRTLAVARSQSADGDDFELVGLLALADPPRPDAQQMIAEARSLGVKPIMVTGDNIAIARQMALELSIGDSVMRMGDLTAASEREQMQIIQGCDVLAEVYPEDKYRVVKLLQAHGHTSGMTGDGVNDAPALKQAEVGIAVKGATNVAKASASMVLTEPGIRVIIDALKTSRQIYQRMLTWVINKVTKTIQLVGLLTLGFFWLHDLVVSLLGMALLVLANDFVTMTLSTDNVKYTRNPNNWNVRNVTLASAGIGVFFILEGWLTILIGRNLFHLTTEGLRSFVLLMLVFTSQFRIYLVRERRHFWDSRPGRGILISSAAAIVVFSILGIFGGIIQGLGVFPVLFLVGFSGLFTFAVELPKYHIFRKLGL